MRLKVTSGGGGGGGSGCLRSDIPIQRGSVKLKYCAGARPHQPLLQLPLATHATLTANISCLVLTLLQCTVCPNSTSESFPLDCFLAQEVGIEWG